MLVRNRGLVCLLLVFALSLPAVSTRLYASDEIQYFAYLRSLWFDRDLSFENEYRYFYDRGIATAFGFHETFLELTTETGRRLNFATLGCAVLWMPFYGVADVSVRVGRAFGAATPADGFSKPYIAAVTYGSALYGFAAVLISWAVARRLTGEGGLSTSAVWLGTPLLFYMYLAPGMAHACSAFAVSLFVLAWLRVRKRWSMRGMAMLGGLAALMTMVREQDVFYVVGPALDLGWTLTSRLRARAEAQPKIGQLVKNLGVGAVVGLLVYTPQVVTYVVLNGWPGPSRIVANKMTWTAPHAVEVLVSPEHGLLVWTPLVLLSIAGLLVMGRYRTSGPDGYLARRIAACAIVMLAGQVYVSGSVETWTVAGAFGQRRFVGATVLLTLGLAALLHATSTHRLQRALVLSVSAIAIWWNLGLMAQFGAGMMDRQRLEPRRNAYNTFVVVPRMIPALAYRYVFDRSSFYAGPQP